MSAPLAKLFANKLGDFLPFQRNHFTCGFWLPLQWPSNIILSQQRAYYCLISLLYSSMFPKMINVGTEKRQLFQTISNKLWKAEVNIFPCLQTTLSTFLRSVLTAKCLRTRKFFGSSCGCCPTHRTSRKILALSTICSTVYFWVQSFK